MKNLITAFFVFTATLLLSAGSAMGQESTPPVEEKITLPEAMILGMVEGLTEYLPVSSTGHLILAADALQLGGFARTENGDVINGPLGPIMEPKPALNAFNIVIQIGAILAVFGIYFQRIKEMSLGLVNRSDKGRKLLILLIIAFLPAPVIGLLLDDLIEKYLFSPLTVAIALAVGGIAMLLSGKLYKRERMHIRDLHDLSIRSALIIGFIQCLAMWPGTSRSMVTILAGLGVGLSMVAAAEFSFLLALPTLTAATLYKTVTNWDALTAAVGLDVLITGIVISTIVAAFSVKFLVHHLTRRGLAPFGVYRIALAAAVLYYFSNQGLV